MEPLWRSRTRSILPGCIRTYSNRMVCLLPFLFTAILNAQPAVQWTKTFGSSLMEVGYSILETDDGGFVMAGVKTSSGDSQEDFWLLKGDANGNLLWDRTFGGTGREYAYSVCHTASGGYALTGFTDSWGAGGRDLWVVVTDGNGNEIWSETVGLTGYDEGRSIAQTPDGGFIVTGYTTSYTTESMDVLLARFDGTGSLLWSRSFGNDEPDCGYDVITTSDGGYAIAGHFSGWRPGDTDVWLIKTDDQGIEEWNKRFGDFGDFKADGARSLQQTPPAITSSQATYPVNTREAPIFGSSSPMARETCSGTRFWEERGTTLAP